MSDDPKTNARTDTTEPRFSVGDEVTFTIRKDTRPDHKLVPITGFVTSIHENKVQGLYYQVRVWDRYTFPKHEEDLRLVRVAQ